MTSLLRKFRSRFRRFGSSQDGTATVEFAILITPMVIMMLVGVEAGIMNLRHVMLERGLDIAIRAVRLGPATPPTHEQIKTMICDQAFLLPDCVNALHVEMRSVSKTAWDIDDGPVTCRDRREPIKPSVDYNPAAGSELVLVRACIRIRPIFPTVGLGAAIEKDSNGDYAALATAVFVNEPS